MKENINNDKKLKIIESRVNNINRTIDDMQKQIQEQEERIEQLEEKNEQLKSKMLSGQNFTGNLSDAERIIIGSWDDVSTQRTKNKDRAIKVVENWDKWSETAKTGDKIMRISKVKNALNVEYQNAKRVSKFVKRLTSEKITKVKDEDGNLALVQEEEIRTDVDG